MLHSAHFTTIYQIKIAYFIFIFIIFKSTTNWMYSVIPIKRTVLLNVLFEKSGDRTV